jgi:hypothetical protein
MIILNMKSYKIKTVLYLLVMGMALLLINRFLRIYNNIIPSQLSYLDVNQLYLISRIIQDYFKPIILPYLNSFHMDTNICMVHFGMELVNT